MGSRGEPPKRDGDVKRPRDADADEPPGHGEGSGSDGGDGKRPRSAVDLPAFQMPLKRLKLPIKLTLKNLGESPLRCPDAHGAYDYLQAALEDINVAREHCEEAAKSLDTTMDDSLWQEVRGAQVKLASALEYLVNLRARLEVDLIDSEVP